MKIEIQDMQIQHVYELVRTLRPEDRAECEALGFTPKEAVRRSYMGSVIRKVTLLDDKVAAGWGLWGTVLGQTGNPWLLTSTEVDRAPLHLASTYRREVKKMLTIYPMLENWCDSRYTKSLKLLKLVGFKVEAPAPFGPKGALFCRFHMGF